MDAQRALLDQLMGVDRNLGEGEELEEVNWADPGFCSFFLAGLCPYMTFTGTKADIGKCTLKHDENARMSFRRAKRYKQRKVDLELVDFIQKLLNDLDRHIRRGNDRIDTIASAPPERDREDVLNKVKEQIKELHEEMETLAKEGQVEKSEKLLEQTKVLEQRRDRMVAASENREDHRLLVCDICGGFQVQEDTNEERVDAHQNGKQHLGYIEVRKMLRELQDRLDKDDFEDRYGADGMVPRSARKSRDRSRSRRKSSGRDRSGSRSRRRSSRDRQRHRSSRHDDDDTDDHRSSRHRSSRSSHHQSSRSRGHRSRSRSRSRNRKSHRSSRAHRSRSRDHRRRHRSRSRDGDRHRSSRHRSSRGDRRSSSRHNEDDDKERCRRKGDNHDDESDKVEKSDNEKDEKDSDVDMESEKSS